MQESLKALKEETNFNINLTRFCHMNCRHCYIQKEVRQNKEYMKTNDLDILLNNISEYIFKHRYILKKVNVRVTGGEILTIPFEILEYIINKLYDFKLNEDFKHIYFDIKATTSLLKELTEEHIQLFKKTRAVFTSLDLDVKRFNTNGFNLFEKNIKLLQNEGIDIIPNITVGKNILNKIDELIEILIRNNIKDVHLSYFVPHNEATLVLLPKFIETSNFMINFHKKILEKNLDILVSPIDPMKMRIKNNTFNDSFICEKNNSFNINTDGSVYLCAAEGGLKDEKNKNNVINIFKDKLTDTDNIVFYKKDKIDAIKPLYNCLKCEYINNCLSACRILHTSIKDNEEECPGFKKVWEYSSKLI